MRQPDELAKNDSEAAIIAAIIKAWLPQITPTYLQDVGWIEINRRRHAQAISARDFANTHYSAAEQGEQRAAFFAGVTFGLLENLHIADIQELREHLMPSQANDTSATGKQSARESAAAKRHKLSPSSTKVAPHDDEIKPAQDSISPD